MNRRRSASRHRSTWSRWNRSPARKRNAIFSASVPSVFSKPLTRYSRPSMSRNQASPRCSSVGIAGGAGAGSGFSSLAAFGSKRLTEAAKEEGAGASVSTVGGGGAGGRAPVPSQADEFNKSASDLLAGVTFCAYSLASMPCGNRMRKTSMPCALNRSASRCAARSPASSAS